MEGSNSQDGREFPRMVDEDDPEINTCNDDDQLIDQNDVKKNNRIIKPTRCKGCTLYVEPLLFLVMLSQFPLMILNPQYVLRRELKKLTGNDSITVSKNSCSVIPFHNISDVDGVDGVDPVTGNYTLAQSAAALFDLQSSIVSSVPAMFVVMLIGPYSDKRGRKIAIILPLLGSMLSSLNTFLNAYFQWPVEMLFIGHFIYGCTGFWVTMFMGCIAFIADVTSEEDRHFRIVMAEICMMVPSVLSSFGSGFWVKIMGFSLVYLTVFLANTVMLLYAIFVIPETVKADPDAKFFSTVFIRKALTVFTKDDDTKRRWKLLVLLSALFFCLLVGISANVDTLFVMNRPLCWGSEIIGIHTAVSMAIGVIGSATTAKAFSCFLRETWIAVVGGVMTLAQNIFKFFVKTTAMMFGSSAFCVTMILFTPTIRALMSKLVKPNEVGAVFGGIAFIELLCGLLGHIIFNPIYSATQSQGHPSLVYLIMGAINLAGVTIMIIYAVLTRKDPLPKNRASSMEVKA